jgi:hypothetical protein
MKTLPEIIGDRVIREAAERTDLDESCLIIQKAIGVTRGDVAAAFFSAKVDHPKDPDLDHPRVDRDEAWQHMTADERETTLRQYLDTEEHFRPAPEGPVMSGSTPWAEAFREFNVGDVLVATGHLLDYPLVGIRPGARLVVTGKDPDMIFARVVPLDEHFMPSPDELREWHNVAQLSPPEKPEEYPLQAVKDNDALPLPHRLAAVFSHLLAEEIEDDNMAAVVRLNEFGESDLVCRSHDFCDANIVMDAAHAAMGLPTPGDEGLEDGTEAHEEACRLWSEAWAIAMQQYFAVWGRQFGPSEAANDEELPTVGQPM